MAQCRDRTCVDRLRQHIDARLQASELMRDDHDGMLALACYGIATLATDPSAHVCLHHNPRQWGLTEDYLAVTAQDFAWEIGALRDHLTPAEQGPWQQVPSWVMRRFVQWPGTTEALDA